MNKQQQSKTWKQLDGLNADTAEAQGWFCNCIKSSPMLGYQMNIYNPQGQLVAWGWSPRRLNLADTIRKAQVAYAAVQMKGGE